MPAPVLSPSSATLRGKAVQHFTSNLTATWTSTAGDLYTDAAATVAYTPGASRSDIYLKAKNETGSFTLTATNGGSPTSAAVAITAELPPYWEWGPEVEAKKRVRVFVPKDGPHQSRTDQGKKETWAISNNDDDPDHYLEMEAFWDYHYPSKTFILIDPVLEREITCRFDSNLKRPPKSNVSIAWSVVVQEV